MIGCDKSDDDTFNRTVLVYMAADNDLADSALRNIEVHFLLIVIITYWYLLIFREKNLI